MAAAPVLLVTSNDGYALSGIPEFIENECGESLFARTECLASFRELGPPDLCHIVKASSKQGVKDVGSYHYVLGIDASSPATLAAYVNTLLYNLDETQGKGTKNAWRIKQGTFCCFNAFSRVDVRVEVSIPGGVDAYIVDLKGERQPITESNIWQELFVSSVLRAILDDSDEPDSPEGGISVGLRKLDPFPNPQTERRFLECATEEFWKSWQLGTEPEVQIATYFSNHLSNGIMKYFRDCGRLGDASKFFEHLYPKEPEIAVLLAQAYLETDEEVKAVHVLYEAIKRAPVSYGILSVQVDFLRSKKRFDRALELAKMAVSLAPSEFCTWSKLTEVYIDLEDHESALLTLNSCPMFTFVEKDAHRMPAPARVLLPLKPDINNPKHQNIQGDLNGTVFDENDPKENEVHPELLQLPAISLRGTFKKAYVLLSRIVAKVGWDELLKCRSTVFVMEDEYRVHRAIVEEKEKSALMESKVTGTNNGSSLSESDRNSERGDVNVNGGHKGGLTSGDDAIESDEVDEDDDEFQSPTSGIGATGAAPASPCRAANHVAPAGNNEDGKAISVKDSDSTSPRSKRLCERWLDNLFMVLYNDLRIYTAIRAEINHYKSNAPRSNVNVLLYRKTGAEWEMFGDLCLRLHKTLDAIEAYKLCLEQKLSLRALLRLLEAYTDESNMQAVLSVAIKLLTILDRAYIDNIFPSHCSRHLFRIIRKHGLGKVQNVLLAMAVPLKQMRLVTRIFDAAEAFRIVGAQS